MDLVHYPMFNDLLCTEKVEGFEWIWCITLMQEMVCLTETLHSLEAEIFKWVSQVVVCWYVWCLTLAVVCRRGDIRFALFSGVGYIGLSVEGVMFGLVWITPSLYGMSLGVNFVAPSLYGL